MDFMICLPVPDHCRSLCTLSACYSIEPFLRFFLHRRVVPCSPSSRPCPAVNQVCCASLRTRYMTRAILRFPLTRPLPSSQPLALAIALLETPGLPCRELEPSTPIMLRDLPAYLYRSP